MFGRVGVVVEMFLGYLFIGEWKKSFSFFVSRPSAIPMDGRSQERGGGQSAANECTVDLFFSVAIRWIEKKNPGTLRVP